ncbi:MAG: hypothetical protein DMF65_04025, partial [Acidobacteria bacterium]
AASLRRDRSLRIAKRHAKRHRDRKHRDKSLRINRHRGKNRRERSDMRRRLRETRSIRPASPGHNAG